VNEIAAPYDMSLAAVSKHLKVLEAAGLISRGWQAQWRPCHLEAKPLEAAATWIEGYQRFWTRNLDSLAQHLEELQRSSPAREPRRRRTRPRTSHRKKKER
jgi:hypothetical protein